MHVLVLRYTLTDTPGRHHSSIEIGEVNSPFLVQKLQFINWSYIPFTPVKHHVLLNQFSMNINQKLTSV